MKVVKRKEEQGRQTDRSTEREKERGSEAVKEKRRAGDTGRQKQRGRERERQTDRSTERERAQEFPLNSYRVILEDFEISRQNLNVVVGLGEDPVLEPEEEVLLRDVAHRHRPLHPVGQGTWRDQA